MTKCTITTTGNALSVKTPYDRNFVSDLKFSIPPSERQWDGSAKVWLVDPKHGKKIQDLCIEFFNELPLLPSVTTSKPTVQQKIIEVRYIGATKDRGGDERSAYGWHADGWNVIFPESVLRAWFDAPMQPDEAQTLYSVLGIKRDATDDEIKSGFRRMVKQWHPDVCREPNAHEQFIAIQHAYTILSTKRERYDAGLALEASLKNGAKKSDYAVFMHGYRSPLRCGLIMCEGIEVLGKFQVTKIAAWQDITDAHGRVLVVSWKAGADHFEEVWA